MKILLPINAPVSPGTGSIETLTIAVSFLPNIKANDASFATDMYRIYASGFSLTSKQLDVCMKILSKYRDDLIDVGINAGEFDRVFNGKICARPVRQSIDYPSEIRYLGQNVLALRAKYSPQIAKAVKRLDKPNGLLIERTIFSTNYRIWLIRITGENLDLVMKLIKDFKIDFDDTVVAFLAQCTDARTMPSEVQVKEDQVNIIVRNDLVLQYWLSTFMKWSEDV